MITIIAQLTEKYYEAIIFLHNLSKYCFFHRQLLQSSKRLADNNEKVCEKV